MYIFLKEVEGEKGRGCGGGGGRKGSKVERSLAYAIYMDKNTWNTLKGGTW